MKRICKLFVLPLLFTVFLLQGNTLIVHGEDTEPAEYESILASDSYEAVTFGEISADTVEYGELDGRWTENLLPHRSVNTGYDTQDGETLLEMGFLENATWEYYSSGTLVVKVTSAMTLNWIDGWKSPWKIRKFNALYFYFEPDAKMITTISCDEHDYVKVSEKPATVEEDGYAEYQCSACGCYKTDTLYYDPSSDSTDDAEEFYELLYEENGKDASILVSKESMGEIHLQINVEYSLVKLSKKVRSVAKVRAGKLIKLIRKIALRATADTTSDDEYTTEEICTLSAAEPGTDEVDVDYEDETSDKLIFVFEGNTTEDEAQAESKTQTVSAAQTDTQVQSGSISQTKTQTTAKVSLVGKKFTKTGAVYKITSAKTVQLLRLANKNRKSFTLPEKVTYKGKTYTVTSIASKAFYKNTKLKVVKIYSKKLTKKSFGSQSFKGIYKKAKIYVPKKCAGRYKKWLKKAGLPSKASVKGRF